MKTEQTHLALRCGVHQSTLSNILAKRRRPSPDVASRLESATGKHRLHWLYPDEFDENGAPNTPTWRSSL